jgi:GNAT superfamily N-acetyltransferase
VQWTHPDGYQVSDDPARLDVALVHRFLSTEAYWSPGVSRDVVERAIAGSIPFGLYAPGGAQAGFARVVTDRATFAYLADVFVLAPHRGRGLGGFLVGSVLAHPELQGLRRFVLATDDAHGIYARFGFAPLDVPERWMERGMEPSRVHDAEERR